MTRNHRRARTSRLALAVGVVVLLGQLVVGSTAAAGAARPVKVMTLNLYIGANLTSALTPGLTPLQVVQAVTDIWLAAQASDIPARAKALAAQIHDAEPDVLAIQEAPIWRVGEVGVINPATITAATVRYDFLTLLHAELAALGMPFGTAVRREVFDAEVPTFLGYEVRLTEFDAILVRSDLPADELVVTATHEQAFANPLVLTVAGVPIAIRRGWTQADVVVNRRPFRVINTHLEPNVGVFRPAQAAELLGAAAAGGTPGPVVVTGDVNSAPGDPGATNAYDVIVGGGFTDAWALANPGVDGYTCCQAADLRNEASALSRRIDHVLVRSIGVVGATRYVVRP
jgi:endonuclease/exonuclease/phosphatase (EEP) superfamily protein YafD